MALATSDCRHVASISPGIVLEKAGQRLLDPTNWQCSVCHTTEDVWGCLTCGNVGCGRTIHEHAVHHQKEANCPLAINLKSHVVWCYDCDSYVENDTRLGDLANLRLSFELMAQARPVSKPSPSIPQIAIDAVKRIWESLGGGGDEPRPFGETPMPIEMLTPQKTFASGPLPAELSEADRRRGQTGLKNLGNTCYANAVIQALSNTSHFRDYMLRGVTAGVVSDRTRAHHLLATPKPPVRVELTTPEGVVPRNRLKRVVRQTTAQAFDLLSTKRKRKRTSEAEEKGEEEESKLMHFELRLLFRVLWSDQYRVLAPHAFVRVLWDLLPQFSGFVQHDAHELLVHMLDVLECEVQRGVLDQGPMPFPIRQGRNPIRDIFVGTSLSRVECLRCHAKSVTTEPFSAISLDIPMMAGAGFSGGLTAQTPAVVASTTLRRCLTAYTTPELIQGCYKCPSCNQTSDCTKTYSIVDLPEVLILHIKRFVWTLTDRKKLMTRVSFPISGLDMMEFLDETDGNDAALDETVFDLHAVVLHRGKGVGRQSSGHYMAAVWNDLRREWFLCNDAKVELIQAADVRKLEETAYVLLYHKKDVLHPVSDVEGGMLIRNSMGMVVGQVDDVVPEMSAPPKKKRVRR